MLSSLLNVLNFSWIMAPDDGTFCFRIIKTYLKTAASFYILSFVYDDKIVSIFLTHVDIIFFDTPKNLISHYVFA